MVSLSRTERRLQRFGSVRYPMESCSAAEGSPPRLNSFPQGERDTHNHAYALSCNLFQSFRYAAQGLSYGFRSQRNFRIHLGIGLPVLILGLWLHLPSVQQAILVLTVAAVLVLELINTAIEAVVDLAVGRQFHPLARIAKDCAAAAVLVAAISSLLIALVIVVPPVLIQFL